MNLNKLLRTAVLFALVACLALVTAAFTVAPSPLPVANTAMNTDINIATLSNSVSLINFIGQVRNGNAKQLVGIYVPDLMALPVVQQPPNNPGYVSDSPATLTQFDMPSRYGTTGILAHNNLAGALFYKLNQGDMIVLVYGDGSSRFFQVDWVRHFQALSPESPYSNFLDLDQPEKQLSSTDLFTQMYKSGEPLIFQTCLAQQGNASWGRVFISAKAYVAPQPVATPDPFFYFGRVFRVFAN